MEKKNGFCFIQRCNFLGVEDLNTWNEDSQLQDPARGEHKNVDDTSKVEVGAYNDEERHDSGREKRAVKRLEDQSFSYNGIL